MTIILAYRYMMVSILLFLVSCAPGQSILSTVTNKPTLKFLSSSREASIFPSRTSSITPSITQASYTPTPNISGPLTKEGPWLVLSGKDGLWVVNADGSGFRRIIDTPPPPDYSYSSYSPYSPYSIIPFKASSTGKYLAYSSLGVDPSTMEQELTLFLLSFPNLTSEMITTLYSKEAKQLVKSLPSEYNPPMEDFQFLEKSNQIKAAITKEKSLAWSYNGNKLAFSAAIDGPSTDVYVLDISNYKIKRITDGSNAQAVNLFWSPDNKFIIHTASRDVNAGRDGPEFLDNELWAADSNGIENHLLASEMIEIIRWVGNGEFLGYQTNYLCPDPYNLSLFNIRNSTHSMIWKGQYHSADIDPISGSILLVNLGLGVPDNNPECASLEPSGLYLLNKSTISPVSIEKYDDNFPKIISPVIWLTKAESFIAFTKDGIVTVSPLGIISEKSISPDPMNQYFSNFIAVSPSQNSWLLSAYSKKQSGLWIYQEETGIKQIYSTDVCKAIWRPDNKGFFFYGNESSEYDLADTLYYAEGPEYSIKKVASALSLSCSIESQWIIN